MTTFRGAICSIRSMPDPRDNIYAAVGDKSVYFRSPVLLSIGEKVEFDEELVSKDSPPPLIEALSVVGNASDGEIGSLLDAIGERATSGWDETVLKKILGRHPEIMSCAMRMKDALIGCAKIFVRTLASGAPIVVRFHNDGDGSTGAISIYNAVNLLQPELSLNTRGVIWKMQRGIAYDGESLYDDVTHFSQYKSAVKPLVVIIDFGTSPESEASIADSENKCDLIWLDHHPPYDGFPSGRIKFYVNPWDFGGNSDFTAGALASVFATVLHECGAEALMEASLVSDYSAYADYGDTKAQGMALVLDFLTSGSKAHGISVMTPKTFSDILGNPKRYAETLFCARNMLDEALEIGAKKAKRYRSNAGFNIHVLDFSYIAEVGKGYPLPGRFSSRLQSAFENANGGKTITVVYYGNYISIRESEDITSVLKILDIVNTLKAATPYVESGGGHNEAASMRVPKQHTAYVMKLLLKHLGVEQ